MEEDIDQRLRELQREYYDFLDDEVKSQKDYKGKTLFKYFF